MDNKEIEIILNELINSYGIHKDIDRINLRYLNNKYGLHKAVEEIALQFGLPIKINIVRVVHGAKYNEKSQFHTTQLSKTDASGKGTEGITAQVIIPNNLPAFGSESMKGFNIDIKVGNNKIDDPVHLFFIIAHEMSHVFLYSVYSKFKSNEYATDLNLLVFGFKELCWEGRKTKDQSQNNSDGSTSSLTTTYGYLNDSEFEFAYSEIIRRKLAIIAKVKVFDKLSKSTEEIFDSMKMLDALIKKYISNPKISKSNSMKDKDSKFLVRYFEPQFNVEKEDIINKIKMLVAEGNSCKKKIESVYFVKNIENIDMLVNKTKSGITELKNTKKTINNILWVIWKHLGIKIKVLLAIEIISYYAKRKD